jgi:hypothetical protein
LENELALTITTGIVLAIAKLLFRQHRKMYPNNHNGILATVLVATTKAVTDVFLDNTKNAS